VYSITKTQLAECSNSPESKTECLAAAITTSQTFITTELPKLNGEVSRGLSTADEFITVIQPCVTNLSVSALDAVDRHEISRDDARVVIQLLGFMVSSAEKHYQARGAAKGQALSLLLMAEQALLCLTGIAGHPPRDSAYTYWVWNADDIPLTFTGSAQEIKFNQVINQSDRSFKEASKLLRPISNWEVSLDSEQAAVLLEEAALKMGCLRDEFMSLMRHKNGPGSERALEPMFFMTEMRLYLVGYPVGGREWEGVSAANLASQMSIDYLIGTTDQEYFEHVKGRFEYFSEEERAALQSDMAGDSVLTVFLQTMGAPHTAFEEGGESILKTVVNCQSLEWQRSLSQYKALVKAAGHLTASHWSLIDNYLLKPSKQLSNTEHAHLTVDPETGTSGMSMADVVRIREMRRNHAIAGRLISCV
jgi:hypothetical protein